MRKRRTLARIVVAAAAAATLLAAQAADAGVPPPVLPDNTVEQGTSAGANFYWSTDTDYWSVVAVTAAPPTDYDLQLWDTNGNELATSTYGAGTVDFIAINSNTGYEPEQSYRIAAPRYSGSTGYYLEARQGTNATTLPTPTNNGVSGAGDPQLAFASVKDADVISVEDVYLTAGTKFWVADSPTTNGDFFFLESHPGVASTYIVTRAQAAAIPGTKEAEGCTLYTANYTGWHGFVYVNDQLPVAGQTQSGTAVSIVGYDPARPNTCPNRNFPAATPPGP
jgi:hypothetical protein